MCPENLLTHAQFKKEYHNNLFPRFFFYVQALNLMEFLLSIFSFWDLVACAFSADTAAAATAVVVVVVVI